MTLASRTAPTAYPVLDVIAQRYSPRAFDAERPIPADVARSMLEAARWASSSRNGQPWHFILVDQDDPKRDAAFDCFKLGNQGWVSLAPLWVFTVVSKAFPDGRDNRYAWHDLGLAVQNMILQGMAHDVYARQLAGIYHEKVAALFNVPAAYEVVTGIAFGYRGAIHNLPEDKRTTESLPRQRHPLRDFVFSGEWGAAAPLVEDR